MVMLKVRLFVLFWCKEKIRYPTEKWSRCSRNITQSGLTAMTDKYMTERNVLLSEMPQISLQISLFHVLRSFGRDNIRQNEH
jgi:hypothetical protein